MIHSGVWGFASSPIVSEDEIRRVTANATEVAKASALAKKFDVRPPGWEKQAATWYSVADVDSAESMAQAREVKRGMKAMAVK